MGIRKTGKIEDENFLNNAAQLIGRRDWEIILVEDWGKKFGQGRCLGILAHVL